MFKVLVVDDDLMLLKMAEELLKSEYTVLLANSGQEALDLIAEGHLPDIILLDINMPKMNGYETLLKLREADKEIPVIFLTGLTETEHELKGLTSGAVDYITKPFIKEILLARLRIHLAVYQKSRTFDSEKEERLSLLLSETELSIARLMALGYTNTEIAEKLNYSYNYVKKLCSSIYEKLEISKRHEIRSFLI